MWREGRGDGVVGVCWREREAGWREGEETERERVEGSEDQEGMRSEGFEGRLGFI